MLGAMPPAPLQPVDAFQIGYLPELVRAHFGALEILVPAGTQADAALAAVLAHEQTAFRERGPEVVSIVVQVEGILAERLDEPPPAPPRSPEECAAWTGAAAAAFEKHGGDAEAYAAGRYAGAAEAALANAVRQRKLWATSPTHAPLTKTAEAVRAAVLKAAATPAPAAACPTRRACSERIAQELAPAAGAVEKAPAEATTAELARAHAEIASAARALEAAAWGTPRGAVDDWLAGRMNGRELARRIVEHRRWTVPCEPGAAAPTPRVFAFDKRVLMAFSDPPALAARPDFLGGIIGADDRWLTVPGWALLADLPRPGVDLVVLDPGKDPHSRKTINYPTELHRMLAEESRTAAVEAAVADWSHLDRRALRDASYWVLVAGSSLRFLGAPDRLGRARIGVFTTEAALDAHLEHATPEQRAAFARETRRMLLPGAELFRALRAAQAAIVFNPSGPGRTRAFNPQSVEMLAS
jgi:hypothetical protein